MYVSVARYRRLELPVGNYPRHPHVPPTWFRFVGAGGGRWGMWMMYGTIVISRVRLMVVVMMVVTVVGVVVVIDGTETR